MYRLRINKLPEYYGLAHKAKYNNTDFILSKISTKFLIFNFLTYEDKKEILQDVLKHHFVATNAKIKNQDLKLTEYIAETIHKSKFKTNVTGDISYGINIFIFRKNLLALFAKQTLFSLEKQFSKEPQFINFIKLLKEKEKLTTELNKKRKRKAKIKANYHSQLLISKKDSKHRRHIYNALRDSLYRTLKILNKVEKKELSRLKINISPKDTKQLINETLKFIALINKYQNEFFTKETLQKLDDLYEMINGNNVRRVFNSLLDIIDEYQYLAVIPEIEKQINILKNITPIGAAIFSSSFKYLTAFVEEEILKNENYIKETKENIKFTSKEIYNKLLKETSKGISSIYEADLMNLQYESTIIDEIDTALKAYKQKLLIMKNIHNKSNIKDYNTVTNEFFNWFKNIILSLNTWTVKNERARAKWIYLIDLQKEIFDNKILKQKIEELNLKLDKKINQRWHEKYQLLFDKKFAEKKQEFIKILKKDKKAALIYYTNKYNLKALKPKYHRPTITQKDAFIHTLFSEIGIIFTQKQLDIQMKDLPPEQMLFVNIFINGVLKREQIIDLDEVNIPLHAFKTIANAVSKLEKILSTRIVLMSSLYIPTKDNHSLLISSWDHIPVEIATSKNFQKKPVHFYTKLQFNSLIEIEDKAINSKIIFRDQIYILPKYNFVKYLEVYKKHFVLVKEKNLKKSKGKQTYEIK